MKRTNRRLLALLLCLCLCASLFPAAYAAGGSWVKNGSGWSYKVNGEYVTGIQEIDGARYYFDPGTKLMLADSWEYLGGSDGLIVADAEGKLIREGWAHVTDEGPVLGSGIFYYQNYHTLHGLQDIDGNL